MRGAAGAAILGASILGAGMGALRAAPRLEYPCSAFVCDDLPFSWPENAPRFCAGVGFFGTWRLPRRSFGSGPVRGAAVLLETAGPAMCNVCLPTFC